MEASSPDEQCNETEKGCFVKFAQALFQRSLQRFKASSFGPIRTFVTLLPRHAPNFGCHEYLEHSNMDH